MTMFYFAEYDTSGKLMSISTLSDENGIGTPITEAEYNRLSVEIDEKIKWYNIVYESPQRITEVPEKWRAEIQAEINEAKKAEEQARQEEEMKIDTEACLLDLDFRLMMIEENAI